MRNFFYFLMLLVLIGCSNNKIVYWCGDHPCINKKEKEAYFKETMIVEIKELKEITKNNSETEKIIQQAKIEEKKRIINEKESAKQAKLEEKRRIKEEKEIAKEAKLEEKRRIKEEKEIAKEAKLEEKRRIKEEKEMAKKIDRDEAKIIKNKKNTSKKNVYTSSALKEDKIYSTKFEKILEDITKKNILKGYPDLNDIPN